jgi:hypothetical protein
VDTGPVVLPASRAAVLLRRGRALEVITLGWNVAGIVVLAIAAIRARSVALAGFGLDSLIEIGASTVVLWELSGSGEDRQRRALRLIGDAFVALAAYLAVQSAVVLATGYRPGHSTLGIAWTTVTAVVMFALAAGKARTGRQLGNPVLATEGRVTLVDGILAVAVLAGLALNAGAGVWWADPLAALVIVFYALREARTIFRPGTGGLRHRSDRARRQCGSPAGPPYRVACARRRSGLFRATTCWPAEAADSTGELTAVFYGRTQIADVEPGCRVRLHGMVGIGGDGHPAMINPACELLR